LSHLLRRVRALRLAAIATVALGLLIIVPVATAAYKPPPIKHVWVIDLENESYAYTFGAAGEKFAPYLTRTLPAQGALLKDYYSTGHDSLDNYIAEVSGQAGNYELNEDCGEFTPFVQFGGENFDKLTKYGQLSGGGCVFPEVHPDDRFATERQAPRLEGVRPGHGDRSPSRRDRDDQGGARLRAPDAQRRRPDRHDRTGQRQLCDAPQPVRVLRRNHRRQALLRRTRGVV
jgi:hypothetical protein